MYCDWPELGRCCFCMPLRQGVLVFGYVSVLFSAYMIGLYSFAIYTADQEEDIHYDVVMSLLNMPKELCVAVYCAELIFNIVLIYGAHTKSVWSIKAYYYFSITTAVATVFLQITCLFTEQFYVGLLIEMAILTFAGLCMQIYLITLVRSLLKKLEKSGPHMYDNQLHQIVNGEFKIETNGVYNNTTALTED